MPTVSDAERKRRSEQAKRQHAEGRFGGAQPGSGRPNKLRTKLAHDLANEMASLSVEELQMVLATFRVLVKFSRMP
jgi:hypothetical protein